MYFHRLYFCANFSAFSYVKDFMQSLQFKTKVWFRPTSGKELQYGFVTEIKVNSISVIEETGLKLITLQWHQQGHTWGKDPNPTLLQNQPSEGWSDNWTPPRI